jgi:hypothetical protein
MLGIEPQKRNRTSTNKNRVTKSKKEGKAKKAKDDESVKEDPDSQESSVLSPRVESPRIKQEMSQPPPDRRLFNSTFTTSAPMSAADMQSQLHARLLTPCSDSDALATSSSYAASPSSDMLHSDPSFDFTGPTHCAHGHGQEQVSWTHGQTYSAFGVNYGLDGYSAGFCGHQDSQLPGDQIDVHQHSQLAGQEFDMHQHTHLASDELQVAEAMMERNDHVLVKHEDWDNGQL